jgi:hypothetical protein
LVVREGFDDFLLALLRVWVVEVAHVLQMVQGDPFKRNSVSL